MAKVDKNAKDPRWIEIGQGLRQLRKDKGFTSYYDIANAMHMNPSQYWKYEKGANMRLSTLIAILDFHKVSLKDFFNSYM